MFGSTKTGTVAVAPAADAATGVVQAWWLVRFKVPSCAHLPLSSASTLTLTLTLTVALILIQLPRLARLTLLVRREADRLPPLLGASRRLHEALDRDGAVAL
mmetsp:Transcript_83745/g.167224  ORF Transcript_83745/g.167224 Transcript_83745/m.167224 type:complete len:102 (-) Transcript_83745:492-797(-)